MPMNGEAKHIESPVVSPIRRKSIRLHKSAMRVDTPMLAVDSGVAQPGAGDTSNEKPGTPDVMRFLILLVVGVLIVRAVSK